MIRTNRLSPSTFSRLATIRRPARKRALRFEPLEDRSVPASLYVDNPGDFTITFDQGAAGLDDGDTVSWTPSGGSHLPVAGLTFGTDAFGTIQSAVTAAVAGDTVNVANGTFSELVNVNKSLVFLGNQFGVDARTRSVAAADESIVNGNAGTTAFLLTANDVTLDGFTVEGQTNANQFGAGIVLGGGTSGAQVRNNIVQNNVMGLSLANAPGGNPAVIFHNLFQNNNNAGPASGHGIYTDQFSGGGTVANVSIDGNRFEGHAQGALGFSSTDAAQPTTGVTISGNEFVSNSRAMYAFNLQNSSIVNNNLRNATDSATADIRLFEGVNNLTITGNVLAGGAGRAVRISNIGTGLADAQNVTFAFNSVTGYTGPADVVAIAGYTGTFDASANYWGTNNPTAVAAMVSGPVDFTPLLNNNESVANQSVVGFQADKSAVTVHALGAQAGTTGRIQEGVNVVDAGGTVFVKAGLYPELVQVNKTVTLLGAQAGVDARTRDLPPADEAVVSGNAGTTSFFVTADDVVIDGFTVQGQTNANQFGAGIVLGAGTEGSEVRNNIIQDNVVGLFLANDSATNPAVVERNHIRHNDNPGPSNGTGIYTDQFVSGPTLTNVLIRDNRFSGANFTWGLNLQNATAATITGNTFETGNAARLANVDNSSFTNNAFSGALVSPPSGFQVTGLNITATAGGGSDNLVVTGNSFTNRLASAVSVSGLSGNLTLTNNTVTQNVSAFAVNTNRYMVSLTGLRGINTISQNTINLTGVMPAGAAVSGIAVQGNFTETVNVTANIINGGNTDTPTGVNDSDGIGIFGSGLGLPSTPTPVFSTVNVTNNFVNGFVDGVVSPNSLNARTTVRVNENDLSGNAVMTIRADANPGSNVIDASRNWHGVAGAAAVAARVVGRVDYTPSLNFGTDVSGAPGFQGDFSSLTAHATGQQVGATGRIQEAVNLLTDGALTGANRIINAGAGTFSESVLVHKPVQILGAQAGVDARTRGAVPESVMNGAGLGSLFTVSASDVTIDGFTVQGQTGGFPGAAIWLQPGTSGTDLLNNIIQNNVVGVFASNNSATSPTTISRNLFRDNTNPGAASGHDIYADEFIAGAGMQNLVIDNNVFANGSFVINSFALGISNTNAAPFTNITFSNNNISNHGRGVYFFNTDGAVIAGNTITGTSNYAVGIFTALGSDNNANFDVLNNTLTGNNRDVWLDGYTGTLDVIDNTSTGAGLTGLDIQDASGFAVLNLVNHVQSGKTTGGTIANVGQINLTTTNGPEAITVSGSQFGTSSLQAIDYSNVSFLDVFALDGDDTVAVSPATNAQGVDIDIHGGNPGLPASPGDTLAFNTPAGQTMSIVFGPPGAGTLQTTGGYRNVDFDSVETLALTGLVALPGTGDDDLLEVNATAADAGTMQLTFDYTGENGGPFATFAIAFTSLTGLTFDGLGGQDLLRINNPAGTVFAPASGIDYNGGGQGDALENLGGSAASGSYTPGPGVGAGAIQHTSGGDTQSIQFTGLNAALDTVADATFQVVANNAANTINLTNGASAVDGLLRASVDGHVPLDFANKTELVLDGGSAADVAADDFNLNFTESATGLTTVRANGIGGADSFAVTATAATTHINGGAGNDTVTFGAGASLSGGTIDGGAGSDRIIGNDAAHTYTLTGPDAGNVSELVPAGFSSVENLTGGSAADLFNFANGGSLTGTINGGGGTDTVDGDDAGRTFNLTGTNAGNVSGILPAGFTNVEALIGGNGADLLDIGAGNLAGSFDGQSGTDTVDMSALGVQQIVVTGLGGIDGFNTTGGTRVGVGLFNINVLTGSASGSTDRLTGRDANATWQVKVGADQTFYQDVGTGRRLVFTRFEELFGGSQADAVTVDFSTGNPLSGAGLTVNGQAGSDSMTAIGTAVRDIFTLAALDLRMNGIVMRYSNLETIEARGGAGNDAFRSLAINLPSALTLVRYFGETGNDSARVTPATLARFHLDGGPGTDTFRMDRNGAVLKAPIPPSGATSGTYFFTNRKQIDFVSFETRLIGITQVSP